MTSHELVSLADKLCWLGAAAALVSGFLHFRALRRGAGPEAGRNPASRLALGCVLAVSVVMGFWIRTRWLEVNHFPSQTMSEVVTMFTAALIFSLVALHFALGLFRRGPGWAILDDALIALTLVGIVFTHLHVETLTTSERDLPPALQSYWFAPHLSSLIYSYATLGIAGLICLVWFCVRFWGGVFVGGRSAKSQAIVLGVLLLVPFLHVVAIPVLVLVGLVFAVLKLSGRMPGREAFAGLERELDDVSFRAFAVGMPFLTAGLWMGAFWAQEAWANYWGWDSKENSALITWLIYVIYIHLRMLGGYRGEKAMGLLLGGALSVFATFQLFGYLPDSQKNSMHKYTDDNVVPREGMQGGVETSASAAEPAGADDGGASR